MAGSTADRASHTSADAMQWHAMVAQHSDQRGDVMAASQINKSSVAVSRLRPLRRTMWWSRSGCGWTRCLCSCCIAPGRRHGVTDGSIYAPKCGHVAASAADSHLVAPFLPGHVRVFDFVFRAATRWFDVTARELLRTMCLWHAADGRPRRERCNNMDGSVTKRKIFTDPSFPVKSGHEENASLGHVITGET